LPGAGADYFAAGDNVTARRLAVIDDLLARGAGTPPGRRRSPVPRAGTEAISCLASDGIMTLARNLACGQCADEPFIPARQGELLRP